jgi:hypothetical protein
MNLSLRTFTLAVALCAGLLAPPGSSAAIIAQEGFDYLGLPLGTPFGPATNGGLGFAGGGARQWGHSVPLARG